MSTPSDIVITQPGKVPELDAPVAAIMTHAVQTCSIADPLNEAARLLWETNCGALPVLGSDGTLAGMITDRDICMAGYTQGGALGTLSVASTMSHQVFSCSPEDSLERALTLMQEKQVRRIPVVRDLGKLVGIISLSDIARWATASPARRLEAAAPILDALSVLSGPVRMTVARATAAE